MDDFPAGELFTLGVRVLDQHGAAYIATSLPVHLQILNNPGGGVLTGPTPVNSSLTTGIATFTNMAITAPGVGYTLRATSGALVSPPSDSFTVTPVGSGSEGTYVVQKTGSSDSNPCTAAAPCLTINKGISKLASGDTLLVRAGVYTEVITDYAGHAGYAVVPPPGTSWANPTTIKCESSRACTLRIPAGHPIDAHILFEKLVRTSGT